MLSISGTVAPAADSFGKRVIVEVTKWHIKRMKRIDILVCELNVEEISPLSSCRLPKDNPKYDKGSGDLSDGSLIYTCLNRSLTCGSDFFFSRRVLHTAGWQHCRCGVVPHLVHRLWNNSRPGNKNQNLRSESDTLTRHTNMTNETNSRHDQNFLE